MSHFDLYNKMRKMGRNFRGSSRYAAGWNPPQAGEERETGYRCPRCADVVQSGARCALCGLRAVPRDATRTDAYTSLEHALRRAHRFEPFMSFWDRRKIQRHTAKLAVARKRFSTVRKLDGSVGKTGRFRGVLNVLAPVGEPLDGKTCGAYVTSRTETERCICKPTCKSVTQWASYESDAGLLTLSDGAQTAFIGLAGRHFGVWTMQRLAPNSLVAANAGDEVEFIGRLRERREIALELGASGYRDAAVTHLNLESPRLELGWLVLQPE